MFTGIIEEVGQVRRVVSGSNSGEIAIKARKVLENTRIGDSIAVNGVCLTVTTLLGDGFTADVMPETLRRTNLGQLKSGDPVDLERAMAADGRFGGHIVSGHIDGTGTIKNLRREENAVWVTIQASKQILDLMVEKGSITIDGISLTVATLGAEEFQVSIIPHTGSETILLKKKAGDKVNLENDILGKYIQRLLGLAPAGAGQAASLGSGNSSLGGGTNSLGGGSGSQSGGSKSSKLSWEFLAEHGF